MLQPSFSQLDDDYFRNPHSIGRYWHIDEMKTYKHFQGSNRKNPNRRGKLQERSTLRRKINQRFPARKPNRKDILQAILQLLV